jgi:hypothetical protein
VVRALILGSVTVGAVALAVNGFADPWDIRLCVLKQLAMGFLTSIVGTHKRLVAHLFTNENPEPLSNTKSLHQID